MKTLKSYLSRTNKKIKFLINGVIVYIFGYFIFLIALFLFNYKVSYFISFVLSVILSYLLHRKVFGGKRFINIQYFLYYLLQTAVSIQIMVFLVENSIFNEFISAAIVPFIGFPISYIYNKRYFKY